jgi:phosphodiesterase/alkaline phosphatase D-like protein
VIRRGCRNGDCDSREKIVDAKCWSSQREIRGRPQFRGNYKYNLLDDNLRAFNAQVPMLAQRDDHEMTNDWSPIGSADETGYTEDGKFRLVERARRAFFEFIPIREISEQVGRIYPHDRIRAAAGCVPDRHAQLS